jgi:ubiquinone/menaquinone biosynthesis C-methylase UbiE
MALADDASPVFVARGMQAFASLFMDLDKIKDAYQGDGAMSWGDHHPCLFSGTEWFFRTGYRASLATEWIPALDGVDEKLRSGAKVADVGCGHGASTTLMARAFGKSRFTGSDYHEESIIQARKRTADAGLAAQVRFEVASAQTFNGGPYDLVTTFDSLHDMGDPLGAARHIREMLAPDGTWMVVEPFAGNSVADNLNPVGRVYYSFSTFLCVPNALSQDGGYSLGAQAGEESIRKLAADAGYAGFRRVAETPFNLIYEVRP